MFPNPLLPIFFIFLYYFVINFFSRILPFSPPFLAISLFPSLYNFVSFFFSLSLYLFFLLFIFLFSFLFVARFFCGLISFTFCLIKLQLINYYLVIAANILIHFFYSFFFFALDFLRYSLSSTHLTFKHFLMFSLNFTLFSRSHPSTNLSFFFSYSPSFTYTLLRSFNILSLFLRFVLSPSYLDIVFSALSLLLAFSHSFAISLVVSFYLIIFLFLCFPPPFNLS